MGRLDEPAVGRLVACQDCKGDCLHFRSHLPDGKVRTIGRVDAQLGVESEQGLKNTDLGSTQMARLAARPRRRSRRPRRTGEDRILSLPNVVTTARLVLVPVFVWLLARPQHRDWFAAAVLLAALGSTDWADGQLARRLNQVTTLGKILDPTADRALLATAAIGILVVGAVPIPIAVIALAREGLVAVAAIGLALARAKRIDVTRIGKAGAFALMCAFPLFLAGHSTIGWHHVALVLAWIAAVIGLVLGWLSVLFYIPLARAALAEGRSGPVGEHNTSLEDAQLSFGARGEQSGHTGDGQERGGQLAPANRPQDQPGIGDDRS